ncbi:MAG: hypothetical protein GY906_38555 [bacterium]|nr:hypothetical protein [bacterium]
MSSRERLQHAIRQLKRLPAEESEEVRRELVAEVITILVELDAEIVW